MSPCLQAPRRPGEIQNTRSNKARHENRAKEEAGGDERREGSKGTKKERRGGGGEGEGREHQEIKGKKEER